MKRNNGLVGLLLIIFLVSIVNTAVVLASSTPAADEKAWVSQIRPGVMGGNGTTDYFLELFVPLWSNDRTLLFFDPHLRYNRGDYFESFVQDEMEENIGFGGRVLLMNGKLILGMNAFFDTMQSKEKNNYIQFGVGFEVLSRWVDFRANYYNPFSTTYNYITNYDRYSFGPTSILLYKGREEAMKGFDAELGFLIPVISDYVETRIAGGAYWYFPEEMGSISGLKGRVEVRPARMINLMYEVKHDDVRGTDQFWGGYLEIPFSFEAFAKGENPFAGVKDALAFGKGARSLHDRMTEKIVRDRNIVTIKYTARDPVSAPGGDDIIYVNSDFTGTGLGTYDAPYTNMASVAGDARWRSGAIVYVFSYDATADTYNCHLVMKENTILWGQGYVHPLWQLGGGPSPILDGEATGNVVTLANGDEIMGLAIQNGEHGIYGQNILTTYIHDNIIRNNLGAEVPSGAIHIVNNFTDAELSGVSVSYRINDNQITGNGAYGVYLSTTVTSPEGQGLNTTAVASEFIGNTVTGNGNAGIYDYLDVNAPAITGLTSINTFTENTVSGNGGYGIYLYNNIHANNTIIPATGDMVASVTASSVTNMFSGNTISSNTGDGINVTSGINASVTASADEAGNLAPGVTGNLTAIVDDLPVVNILEDNIVTGNGNNGIYIKTDALAEAIALNVDVTSNIGAYMNNSGVANTLTGNEITGGGTTNGIYIESNIISHAQAHVQAAAVFGGTSNVAATIGGSILATTSDSPLYNTITNNTVNGNTGNGLYIKNNTGAYAESYLEAIAWVDSVSSGSLFVGGDIIATVSGSQILNTLTNNAVTGNGADGVYIENDITAHAEDYALAYANGLFLIWIYPSQSSAVSNVDGDIQAFINSSSIMSHLNNNTISSNAGDGVEINDNTVTYAVAHYGTYMATSSDMASVSMTVVGDATKTDDSVSEIYMRQNQVTGNTQNGVNLNANTGGTYTADLGTASSAGNNSLYDNGDGITYYGLRNNTGTLVNTLNNWWGMDADPMVAGQISNVSGTTDYDPWRTSAP
jgi:hypothetical protein